MRLGIVPKLAFVVSTAAMLFVVGLVTLDVSSRRFANFPLTFSYELVSLAFIFVAWGAIVLVTCEERHINVEFIYGRFNPLIKRILQWSYDVVSGIILIIVGLSCGKYALDMFKQHQTTQMLSLPTWIFVFFCAVSSMITASLFFTKLGEKWGLIRWSE